MISNLERTLDGFTQEGVEEGKEAVVKKLLLKGMDCSLVAEVTDLPIAKIEAMKKEFD